MSIVAPPEQRVVLRDVSWETYERLLADLENSSAPRLTFDRGVLEIMSPLSEHEKANRTISLLVEVFAEEMGLEIENLGSTTFKREDMQRGFEPDSCFYVRNADRIRGKKRIDPAVDPPPDLVIEVDLTSDSLKKFDLYAQFGVPEVWRYESELLNVFVLNLDQSTYISVPASRIFPQLTAAILSSFIQDSQSSTRLEWLKKLRAWLQEQRG